jgi:hypothetical protein
MLSSEADSHTRQASDESTRKSSPISLQASSTFLITRSLQKTPRKFKALAKYFSQFTLEVLSCKKIEFVSHFPATRSFISADVSVKLVPKSFHEKLPNYTRNQIISRNFHHSIKLDQKASRVTPPYNSFHPDLSIGN